MSKMKLKTRGTAKKRILVTAGGRLKRRKAFHAHILTKKGPNRKRRLVKNTEVASPDQKRIKLLMN